jgi:nitroimidazol reductase NimA-like FMN-containing flavoprotein (pyridoxamine 5'-phosphate oxidase superfamily)
MKAVAGTSATEPGALSDRVRVRRQPARGHYDRAVVEAILDEGFVCHLGFSVGDTTWVLPTAYGRDGDVLYLHGAPANHALATLQQGVTACATVTLVDGLVLARSAFHHSINYRSVVVFGQASLVTDVEEKRRALEVVLEHIVPGRSIDARPPTDGELRKTSVLRLPISESSAKVRTGGPVDDLEDLGLPVWAGQLPLVTGSGAPVAEPSTVVEHPPAYVTTYRRVG